MSAIQVSFDSFDEQVLQPSHERLVILDISAEWCGPCKVLEPIINTVTDEYESSELLFAKLEAEDENMKIAGRYGVRGFPTVIAFVCGEEVGRFHSAQSAEFVRDFIDTYLEH